MQKLLTIVDISKMTGIPPSTLRYYRDVYSNCIYIFTVGEGKRKRYLLEAVDVFLTISKSTKQGLSTETIISILKENHSILNKTHDHNITEKLNNEQIAFIQTINQLLDTTIKMFVQQNQEISHLHSEIEIKSKEIEKRIESQVKNSFNSFYNKLNPLIEETVKNTLAELFKKRV